MRTLDQRLSPEERRRAELLGDYEAAGTTPPKVTEEQISRERTRQLLADPQALETLFEDIAAGRRISDLARKHGIRYNILYRALTNAHGDRVAAARAAYAEDTVYSNLELADDLQQGRVDPAAGRAAAGIRQWFAERASNEQWGQRSTTNVNVKGIIGLHLEAIQQLADVPLEGEVEDADYEEVPQVESKSHPLL